ncbi:hypothetical protein AA313_de0200862 [Arthrobotrys entomopaga]|nr:hypothetical protein AA313_de0200862 [Arthrobotrys entomopaga]
MRIHQYVASLKKKGVTQYTGTVSSHFQRDRSFLSSEPYLVRLSADWTLNGMPVAVVSEFLYRNHSKLVNKRRRENAGKETSTTLDRGFIFPAIEEEYYLYDYDDSRRDSANPFYIPLASRCAREQREDLPPYSFDDVNFRRLQDMLCYIEKKHEAKLPEKPHGIAFGEWCVFGDRPREKSNWTIDDFGRRVQKRMEEQFEGDGKAHKVFGVAIAGYEALLIELEPKTKGCECIWSGVYDLENKGHQREFLWLLVNAAADAYRGENMYTTPLEEEDEFMR